MSLLGAKWTMATFAFEQGKKRDGSSLSSVVDFLLANARVVLGVSGAAVLAIATLAVKRLIDRATSPPDYDEDDMKAKQKSLEESWQEQSLIEAVLKPHPVVHREDLEEPLLSPATSMAVPDSEGCVLSSETLPMESQTLLCLTLQEKLLSYLRDHSAISEAEKALRKQLAENLRAEVQDILKNKFSDLPFGTMYVSGSFCSNLGSGHHLQVAFMLPLILEPNLWCLIPGEQTVMNNPCFWLIRRTGLEYFPRGHSPWDKFIVGGYLSSNTINDTLWKRLVTSVNWPAIGTMLDCVVRPTMDPKELKLEVRHEQIQLEVILCPMTETKDKVLLAVSGEEPAENLWHRSFHAAEVSRLKGLDARDSGVRQHCLGILKSAFKKHPSWNKMTISHLRQVILHLSETESDWSEARLADRLQEVLEELIRCLENSSLPCYFDSRINLFEHLLVEEIDEIGYALYEALIQPDLMIGLGL